MMISCCFWCRVKLWSSLTLSFRILFFGMRCTPFTSLPDVGLGAGRNHSALTDERLSTGWASACLCVGWHGPVSLQQQLQLLGLLCRTFPGCDGRNGSTRWGFQTDWTPVVHLNSINDCWFIPSSLSIYGSSLHDIFTSVACAPKYYG